MQISAGLNELQDITQASLIMATTANLELLIKAGLIETLPEARNNDLLLAVEGNSENAVQAAVIEAEAKLNDTKSILSDLGAIKNPPRSIEMALSEIPDANLALISCPGDYASAEAQKSFNLGLDVMMFSDNVPVEEEVSLKKMATTKGRLMMGPDCGTAILNGVPLGFANKVGRGNIGIIAASGTGLQQVSCLIDRWGGGISQAIGTGGRDLNAQVGGSTMIACLDALAADENTNVIVLISKPPSPEAADKVLGKAATVNKPVIVSFLGNTMGGPLAGKLVKAKDLETAAHAAVRLTGIDVAAPERHLLTADEVEGLSTQLSGTQRYVWGLYSGGTFSYAAILLLTATLGPIH